MHKKILVIGGTGFVGHWLKQTQPPDLKVSYIGHRQYDLMNWQYMNYDYIIHAALCSPVPVLEKALRFGSRVLYISSGIVYQEQIESEYRQAKIDGEKECIDSDMDVSIARLFAFYGEKLSERHAIVAFEKAAKAGDPLRIWGDGNTVRTYMSGADMARRLWVLLFHGERGQVYDVGSTEPVTMLQLAMRLVAENGSRSEIIVQGEMEPMPYYVPQDAEKTERLYGLYSKD